MLRLVIIAAAAAVLAPTAASVAAATPSRGSEPKERKICRTVEMPGRITPKRICRKVERGTPQAQDRRGDQARPLTDGRAS